MLYKYPPTYLLSKEEKDSSAGAAVIMTPPTVFWVPELHSGWAPLPCTYVCPEQLSLPSLLNGLPRLMFP